MNLDHTQFVKKHFFRDGFFISAKVQYCKEDLRWLMAYDGTTASERVWNVLHKRPKCHCGNLTPYIDFTNGYRKVCCRRCAQTAVSHTKSTRHLKLWDDEKWKSETIAKMKLSHFKARSEKKLKELQEKDIIPLDPIIPGFDNEYRWQHKCGEVFTKPFKRTFSIYCPKCHVSRGQGELYEFIRKNYSGVIIVNDRTVLAPKEIDIYLPSLNLGFEFNGKYWHQGDGWRETIKVQEAENVGIKIINVWETEWYKDRNKVLDEVRGAIGL